jgi:phage shock protein C
VPDRLYRSRGDRMLFGVAGGLARYLNVDSSIVRIVWVLLFFAACAGILLYIVAAVLIPEEPAGYVAGSVSPVSAGDGPAMGRSSNERRGSGDGAILIGVVLLLVGGWLLLERFLPALEGRIVWPAILIIVGLVLVLGSLRGRGRA